MDLALSTINDAMTIPSSSYRIYMRAGIIYELSNNLEQALRAYQQALLLSPNSQDPLQAIERVRGLE